MPHLGPSVRPSVCACACVSRYMFGDIGVIVCATMIINSVCVRAKHFNSTHTIGAACEWCGLSVTIDIVCPEQVDVHRSFSQLFTVDFYENNA